MVAKSNTTAGSPPSTSAGSVGDTVATDSEFHDSEIFVEPNPLANQARQPLASMTSEELATTMEGYGSSGEFLESILVDQMMGGDLHEMLRNSPSAPQAAESFAEWWGLPPHKVMAIWARIAHEERSQAAGAKARDNGGQRPRRGKSPQAAYRYAHAKADDKSEDRDAQQVLKAFAAHRAPAIDLKVGQLHDFAMWTKVRNGISDWLMPHAPELGAAVHAVMVDPNATDPLQVAGGLSELALIQDKALGGHLYAKSSAAIQDLLAINTDRYGPTGPSAVKIYHHLTAKLHKNTRKARTKLTDTMSDATKEGRWKPVKDPGLLEGELAHLDKAVLQIQIMSGNIDGEAGGIWRSALDRLISDLETNPKYFVEFGYHVMNFKKDNESYTAQELREAVTEPASVLATNYRPAGKSEQGAATYGEQDAGAYEMAQQDEDYAHRQWMADEASARAAGIDDPQDFLMKLEMFEEEIGWNKPRVRIRPEEKTGVEPIDTLE